MKKQAGICSCYVKIGLITLAAFMGLFAAARGEPILGQLRFLTSESTIDLRLSETAQLRPVSLKWQEQMPQGTTVVSLSLEKICVRSGLDEIWLLGEVRPIAENEAGQDEALGEPRSLVLFSKDRGRQWQELGPSFWGQSAKGFVIMGEDQILALQWSFGSEDVPGFDTRFLYSANSGKSWQELPSLPEADLESAALNQMGFEVDREGAKKRVWAILDYTPWIMDSIDDRPYKGQAPLDGYGYYFLDWDHLADGQKSWQLERFQGWHIDAPLKPEETDTDMDSVPFRAQFFFTGYTPSLDGMPECKDAVAPEWPGFLEAGKNAVALLLNPAQSALILLSADRLASSWQMESLLALKWQKQRDGSWQPLFPQ